jgi:hypothetical protein
MGGRQENKDSLLYHAIAPSIKAHGAKSRALLAPRSGTYRRHILSLLMLHPQQTFYVREIDRPPLNRATG